MTMKKGKYKFTISGIMLLILFIFMMLLPQFLNSYQLRIFVQASIYMIFAMSLNLLMGIGGAVSFGHAAFYGIGAYTAAILCMRYHMDFSLALLLIMIVSGLSGCLLALPMSRVTGRYVTIVTLGFCEIVNIIMKNWISMTNGTMGIINIPNLTIFGYTLKSKTQLYYVVLIFVAITYILIQWLIHSKLGRNLRAMKDDHLAAEAMGIKIFNHKVIIFTISAVFAGVSGALYAHFIGYIDPTCFTSALSFTCISIVVVGGLGNFIGVLYSALFLSILPEYLRNFDFLFHYRMIVYGIILVLVMWLNHSIQGEKLKKNIEGMFTGDRSKKERTVIQ